MVQRDISVQPGETEVTAALRAMARIMGWAVTSTMRPHSGTSYHRVGQAVDLADRDGPGWDTPALLRINEQIFFTIPHALILELIYAGPGNVCVKNGKIATYPRSVMDRHHNHVHLAVVPTFIYSGSQEVAVANDPNLPDIVGPVQLQVLFNSAGECTGYFIFSHSTGELHGFGPGARFHGRSEVVKLVAT